MAIMVYDRLGVYVNLLLYRLNYSSSVVITTPEILVELHFLEPLDFNLFECYDYHREVRYNCSLNVRQQLRGFEYYVNPTPSSVISLFQTHQGQWSLRGSNSCCLPFANITTISSIILPLQNRHTYWKPALFFPSKGACSFRKLTIHILPCAGLFGSIVSPFSIEESTWQLFNAWHAFCRPFFVLWTKWGEE